MGPAIILDKSVVHGLGYKELEQLSEIYMVVIPPILFVEMLADLAKGENLEEAKNKLKALACKVSDESICGCTDYKTLCKANYQGQKIAMNGQVPVLAHSVIKEKGVVTGFVFDDNPIIYRINKWKEGAFKSDEVKNALEIRAARDSVNWKEAANDIFEGISVPELHDFGKIKQFVEQLLDSGDGEQQMRNIDLHMQSLDMPYDQRQKILGKWEKDGKPLFKNFAPYAYYCLVVELMFYYGVKIGFIKTGTKHHIAADIVYLYYLPFCHAFASNDAFFPEFACSLMRDDQTYIDLSAIKNDLRKIGTYWESLTGGEREKEMEMYAIPPVSSLIAFKIRENCGMPIKKPKKIEMSEEARKQLVEKLNELKSMAKPIR